MGQHWSSDLVLYPVPVVVVWCGGGGLSLLDLIVNVY